MTSNIPSIPPLGLILQGAIKATSLQIAFWDQFALQFSGFSGIPAVPPVYLRARVHGGVGMIGFLQVGQRCAHDLKVALKASGYELGDFTNVLDFGCGSGRTMVWLEHAGVRGQVNGTDIDAEAIDWCARHLKWASFSVNGPKPPTTYRDHTFDLIYAISVFTHFPEEFQDLWLAELRRIAQPGGIVLVTLHGPDHFKNLPPDLAQRVENDGIGVMETSHWRGLFPAWYRNTYHSEGYVRERFGRYFEVLNYIATGLNRDQDIVVLRKRLPEDCGDFPLNAHV